VNAGPHSEIEVFTPTALACPHPVWRRLRQEAPVHQVHLPGIAADTYLVSRKSDIEYVCQHPEVFSSHPDPAVWRWGDLGPEFAPIFAEGGYRIVDTIVTSDPPEAARYRKIMNEVLSVSRVHALQPVIQGIIDELLAAIPDGEPVDFRAAFAVPLPLKVIAAILGLPPADSEFVYWFTTEYMMLVDPSTPLERAKQAAKAFVEAQKYLASRIAAYRSVPADNFLSLIANARGDDGERLTMEEALSIAFITTIGGNETTRNALATIAYLLAAQPSLWEALREDERKIPRLVEEGVRYGSPAATTPRRVLRDTELGGVRLPAGATLFMLWGSGSGDETHFEDPAQIRLDRPNWRNHTSFGHGLHHCAGLHLARSEMIASVQSWLKEFRHFELAVPAADIHFEPAFAIRALERLPLRVARR